MRLINKKSLVLLTSILLVIISILVINQTKPVELDEVKLIESSNNNSFAMYRETNNGYEEYNEDKFPEGYVLNITESKCLDNKGNEQKGILSYENGLVTVTSGNTSYCYLYFDESLGLEIKNKNPNRLSTEVKGDMYRFQGQQADNVENYICFGTSDSQICKDYPDQYMYRIIGIEAKTGRVKVIKIKTLDDQYQWWSNSDDDVKWPDSLIFSAINGTDFLDNPTYIPLGWKDKISDNNWLYGDMIEDRNDGGLQTAEGLFEVESGKRETSWRKNKELVVESGYWKGNEHEIIAKIGLVYLHDYTYSVDDEAKCNFYHGREEFAKCRTGWMHLSNNEINKADFSEWTMTRGGVGVTFGNYFGAFHINGDSGYFKAEYLIAGSLCLRPVFYIDASQTLKGGTGKIDDPFLIA